MPEQSNDYRIIVFGADSVGKSSLVLRFVKGTFSDSYVPTIEDTYQQVISCNRNVCTLQITDCSGSHQFPAMQQLNINKGHAFMLVYSITSRQSLDALLPIYDQIRELKDDSTTTHHQAATAANSATASNNATPIIIVGNKSDEESKRQVPKELAAKLVGERLRNCAHLETSAKLDVNVQQAFQDLLSLDKTRVMSLKLDLKKSRAHLRKEKLIGKCQLC